MLCFPSSAHAELVVPTTGETVPIRMDELRVGDRIAAAFMDGTIGSDVVSRLSLAQTTASRTAFLSVTTDANRTLTLTAGHRVPVGTTCCAHLKQAKDLVLGNTVWIKATLGPNAALVAQRVVTMDIALEHGLHSPVLMHGGLPIVDGVVTSFDSWSGVSFASFSVPLLEPICEALGTCNALRSFVANVECAAQQFFTANTVCATYHYIDGHATIPNTAVNVDHRGFLTAKLATGTAGILAAILVSSTSGRRRIHELPGLPSFASLPVAALTLFSSVTKAGAVVAVQGYSDAACTTEDTNVTYQTYDAVGCITSSGQSISYDCSGDLVSVTLYNASENCSGSAFGGLMTANVSAVLKEANNGGCVANLLSYPSARVVSGSLCAPNRLDASTEDVNGLSAGAIAGISVGSTVVAAAIILGALRARKRSKSAQVRVQPKSNTHATDVHK